MSGRIHILPPVVADQIAAGEVVERPASVVKELVENSLDAGARRVQVAVEEGGVALVCVTDDGEGMSREDAVLALRRHATSKLRTAEDLRAIRTLGFRGEALPSIASVSRLTLTTRRAEDAVGTQVRTEAGAAPVVSEVGCPAGTRIEVRDLFFNVPARLKFLRRPSTELGHVQRIVSRMAACRPDVHFSLDHSGRTLLECPAERNLADRLVALMGTGVADHLFEVYLDGPVCVRGYLSDPNWTRTNTNELYTYVNGRYVRDRVLFRAITAAYGTALPRGRYPAGALFVDLDPHLVDVNVHPTKIEVRFVRSGEVFAAVQRAVRMMVAAAPWIERPRGEDHAPESSEGVAETEIWMPHEARPSPPAPSPGALELRPAATPPTPQRLPFGSRRPEEALERAVPGLYAGANPQERAVVFGELRYVGQLHRTYLVCEDDDGIVLVDQHAAHERVHYERLRQGIAEASLRSVQLLVPAVVQLDAARRGALEEYGEVLRAAGFELEPFGEDAWAVRAVPAILEGRDVEAAVRALLDDLAQWGAGHALAARIDRTCATAACHAAVRAGDALSPQQVHAIFAELDRIPYAANCPHGRPVLVRRPWAEVERWFGRR